jgi:hypothetical protein
MGLFGAPKIQGAELKECLSYYNDQLRIGLFQAREAALYNEAIVKYMESARESRLAASEVAKAANRLSQAVAEILRRHKQLARPPNAAEAMHSAWYAAYSAYSNWASASSVATEAMLNGANPNRAQVQRFLEESNRLWRRAKDEEKKFVLRLKVDSHEYQNMLDRATSDAAVDSWKPEQIGSQ